MNILVVVWPALFIMLAPKIQGTCPNVVNIGNILLNKDQVALFMSGMADTPIQKQRLLLWQMFSCEYRSLTEITNDIAH